MTEGEVEGHALSQAATLHQAGRIAEAAAMYEALLVQHPQDAELLALFGNAQFELGREEQAQGAWRRSLAVEAPAEVRLRTIANMMSVAKDKGRTLDFMADLAIPDWPQGSVPDSGDRHMIIALARGLVTYKRVEAASRFLDSVLPNLMADTEFVKAAKAIMFAAAGRFDSELPDLLADADFVKSVVAVMLEAGKADKVAAVLRPWTSRPETFGNGLIIHAAAALLAGRQKEARDLTRRAAEAMPIYLTAKEPGQVMLIGVLNRAPVTITNIVTPGQFHFYANTPGNLASRLNDQYRFLSIFPQARSALAALATVPKPRLILNNWVNAEVLSAPETLQHIANFADQLDLPVLNHPRKAAATTREGNADRLAGIPDLVVPRVMSFANKTAMREQVARDIGKAVGFPVIIRDTSSQRGLGAQKVDSPEQLSSHLATLPNEQLYAIEYVDNPSAPGVYRKMRAAVIGDELFITLVHFGQGWNVHRGDPERLKAFDVDGKFAAYAARIAAAPKETLGRPAMAALHEIRRRIPLDFFGIDFDILPDGQVLFFEANASMKMSLSVRLGGEDTRPAMRGAIRKLFLETAGIKSR